jgi:hypothetical protein
MVCDRCAWPCTCTVYNGSVCPTLAVAVLQLKMEVAAFVLIKSTMNVGCLSSLTMFRRQPFTGFRNYTVTVLSPTARRTTI